MVLLDEGAALSLPSPVMGSTVNLLVSMSSPAGR
jgi:hypothetical protein